MRTKSFILTFLMMMFCSIGFGQSGTGNHWNPDEHQYANNMDVIAIIEIDDVEQKTESLEVGAFCGTELRASSRPMKAPMLENRYIVFLDILGDDDDDLITFKLYDHSQGIELNYVIEKPINFRFGQDPLGSVDAPYVLEFLTPVAKIGDVHYRTLPLAVEAATAGQTVELVADATGAGVVINKDVTIDFGGFTYTVNQAVGSTGTESQGFQLLKNNTVTLKNGAIDIVAGTNVKWMFNAYADVTLENLNVNCANMAAENEANYVLVVNNGGSATPTVNYSGVNVTNFPSTNQIWLDPTTTFKAVAGLEDLIETEEGYVVVYNNGEYTAVPAVASITANEVTRYYATLQAAVNAAQAGETVTLLQSATGAGVVIDKNVTIDFGGKTYTVNQAVGSAGTETLGFQILKGKTVTLMNGTLTSTAAVEGSKEIKMLIQNYAHLTLSKMNLVDNTGHILYALSNNSGNVNLVGNTNITTDEVAFDVYDYSSAGYEVPTVNVKTEGIIKGRIEVSATATLNIKDGSFTNPIAEAWCADGYIPTTEVVGGITYYTVKEGEYVAQVNDGAKYESLVEAYDAAQSGATVKLLKNTTGAGLKINKNITVDFGGNTYTINQAVGSTGTESQGFQLLPSAENVTLKNGNIAVVSGTNVIWMINDYAKNLTVEDMTFDCAGMKLDHSALMGLVINNANATNPQVEFEGNVSFTNLPEGAQQILLENNTSLTAGEGWMNAIEPETGYVVIYNNGVYTVEKAVAQNVTTGEYYLTLVEAVSAATANDEVKLLAPATGAGLVINKNITVDFGGFTYTINQAVGSTGTESQGFQLLTETENVKLMNGNIAVAAGTNVVWMINDYAKNLTVEDMTFDCANMVWTKSVYFLVGNNEHGTNPKAVFNNVVINNYNSDRAMVLLENNTELTAQAGLNVVTDPGFAVVYENGTYKVIKEQKVKNITRDLTYPTLAEAIGAATAKDTLQFLANITENVTVSKNLTIDGAGKEYTGIMTGDAGMTVAVQNLDFVGGRFTKETKSTSGTYTFKNCTFDGNNNTLPYALRFKGATKVTVEDCTVKNYLYSFLYIANAATTVNVKNVTVEDCPDYAVYFASGVTNSTIENLTVKNSDNGIVYNNTANRAFNLKDCTFENVATAINAAGNGDKSITCNMSGTNDFGTSVLNQYAKIVLTAADATLEATEGLNVTTNVADHIVAYENRVYKVIQANYVAAIGDTKYLSLQAAIDAAQGGNVIEVIEDINVGKDDVVILEDANGRDKYNTFFKVEGKAITINLNGHNITGDVLDIEPLGGFGLIAIFSIQKGGNLTLNDNGNTSTVKIDNSTVNNVYSLISCYDEGTGSKLTINGGNYTLEKAGDNLVHSAGDDAVIINGGTFTLGNVGEDGPGSNYNPWIFNANGKNQRNVIVNGGTFNFDINHQFWANEVYVPETLALKNNGNGTWTVVDAVAYVTEISTSTNASARNVGYATLAEAVNPLGDPVNNTVTVIKAHKITSTAVVERDITIDFGGLEVTCSANPAIRIQGNVNVTVKNGNMNTEGYNFILGASDGSSAGNLTIESGIFHGTTTVASVTKGNLNITGGEFSVEPYQGNYAFLINCIDANYNNETATVAISGGKFHNWNPENNAAEGAGTNFCATGYMAEKIECEHGDCYEVIEGVYVAQVGEVKYKTVAAAVAAATAGETVTLIANVTEDVAISKSLTIDGANFEYTGNIAVSGTSTAMTVKNVNFVNGTYYAIKTDKIKSITVESCTVNNYSYGFLYANKSTPTVVVKNVTVDGGNYGFHWVYGTKATLENVTMTNVTNGLYIQNYASKTINLRNCEITTINIWERSGYSGVQTFNFEGANTVGTLSSSQYAKYVLAATDATLTAPEGSTVTTTFDDYKVAYGDGKYYLKPCDYVAEIVDGAKYESLQTAIDEAVDDDEIVVLKDITLEYEDAQDATVKTFFNVNTGKTITIDLNGNNVKAVLEGDETVTAFFHISNSTNLTLKDLSDDNTGTVEIESEAYVSTLLCNDGGYLTVENGNYILEKGKADGSGSGGLVYSGQDEVVTINGGYFYLGNVGTSANGSPWIFNASEKNTKNIIVNGGIFNDDILHQYYPFEVMAPKEKALQYNEGLWTMVDAVAYVDEQHKSGNYYTNEVGYATLEEAVAARKYNENADHVMTVTLLKEIDLGNTTLLVDSDEDYKNSNINFDFAEKDVEGSSTPAIRIQGGANVTIKNGKMNTTGYNFILGASDGSSAGNLTIESGEYHAQTSVVSVTKGHLNITGGEFSVEPYQGNYAYLINCIDANYNNETATVAISGGKFHNWNPENNAAEGAGTNFCASGYGAVETSTGVWEVVPMQGMKLSAGWNWFSSYIDINGEAGLVKLQDALNPYGVQIKGNGGFTQYTEGQGWFGTTLTSVSVKEMYMINMTEDHELQLKGKLVDPAQNAITLEHGWNWIGYQLNQELDLNDALSKLSANNGDFIKTHNGIAQYIQGYGWWGTLTTMKPGVGYMYDNISADDNTLVYSYPEEGAKTELRTNVTSDNNRWVPVSYKYAHNMNIIAVVEGMESENYEVAAFVDGEVRGSARPIYVEPLDANIVFLTIYGDDVEEMTFKCYDLATGEEYDLNNRMNYSDDAVVGSIDNPYLLSRGTTGIGESAMSEVNIYPNPTTTGSEVNLGSVCDTVEVFNALGVKIAEYTNVDAIDALETAGIYVIRITNDGNVQNCRLIVK